MLLLKQCLQRSLQAKNPGEKLFSGGIFADDIVDFLRRIFDSAAEESHLMRDSPFETSLSRNSDSIKLVPKIGVPQFDLIIVLFSQ